MIKKIIISSEELKARAVEIIKSLPLEPVLELTIKTYKKNRSVQQNAYYWKIITIIGNELGMDKDEMHEAMKERFLTKIFIRDDPGYAEMVLSIHKVGTQDKTIAAKLKTQVVRLTSTTQANIKQFSEYIDDVKRFAASMEIILPAPEYE